MKKSVMDDRHRSVVKSNDLVQRSKFNLSLVQQKIILYLISHIDIGDTDFKTYEFAIGDFCRTCGIDEKSGRNYANLKDQIKALRDKSAWITTVNESGKEVETLVSWINKASIEVGSGTIKVRLDDDMKPFLLELKRNFTKYELIYTLRFKSKYSVRLYELIKSIHYDERLPYQQEYSLEELKQKIGAETYTEWQPFYRRALSIALKEINAYSDKVVSYTTVTKGRKIMGLRFTIDTKSEADKYLLRKETDEELGIDPNQMTLDDLL